MAAPRTMILLDPDMDPDPAPKATSVKRTAASSAAKKSADFRLPSARAEGRRKSADFLAAEDAAVLFTEVALGAGSGSISGSRRIIVRGAAICAASGCSQFYANPHF